MRHIRSVIGSAVVMFAIPASILGQQIAMGEYAVPIQIYSPWGIATGSDGNLWFTQAYYFKVGRLTTSGSFTIFNLPTQLAQLEGIAAGPDGALWATDVGTQQIWRIATTGQATGYPFPGGASMTAGPDGALWFTEQDAIGRITTSGAVTEFPIPTANSLPGGITAGPDGALWFTEQQANQIGRVTTSGSITEYPVAYQPQFGITAGPDGALWFIVYIGPGEAIARMTTSGAVTLYPLPNPTSASSYITSGPDGALWFTEYGQFGGGGAIGRITTSGTITEYPSNPNSQPGPITTGPDGNLWFVDGNKIGQTVKVSANLSASPDTAAYQAPLEFTGSGFAAGENVLIYLSGIGSTVLTSAAADSSGGITAAVRTPPSPLGPRIFLGLGQTSGKFGAASFSENPRLVMIPDSGTPGSSAVINAAGFPSSTEVEFFWDKPSTNLGRGITFPDGSLVGKRALPFKVPAGASPGIHIIYTKKGGTSTVEAKFTVE
jgi:virginiamycin B lyase